MELKNYYQILGVTKSITPEELKRVYRELAKKFHPDHNPSNHSAEERFKEICKAYEILIDPQKRSAYDAYGEDFSSEDIAEGSDLFDFSKLKTRTTWKKKVYTPAFSAQAETSLKENAKPRPPISQRGKDIRKFVYLTFEEAILGTRKSVTISHTKSCQACEGSGLQVGSLPLKCNECQGLGKIEALSFSGEWAKGHSTLKETCSICKGAGFVTPFKCYVCKGLGYLSNPEETLIALPAGIFSETEVRFPSSGQWGLNCGENGDLIIKIYIAPHETLVRHGNDIYHTVPLAVSMAILGGDIEVPTVYGNPVKIKIPAGTQPGDKIILSGLGVPAWEDNPPGNQIIFFHILIPKNLTDTQRKLIEAFAKEEENLF